MNRRFSVLKTTAPPPPPPAYTGDEHSVAEPDPPPLGGAGLSAALLDDLGGCGGEGRSGGGGAAREHRKDEDGDPDSEVHNLNGHETNERPMTIEMKRGFCLSARRSAVEISLGLIIWKFFSIIAYISRSTPVAQSAPRNLLTRWDVSSIPANGIFLSKN